VYPLQGRLRLQLAAIFLAGAVGCTQPPPQKGSPGNLPGPQPNVNEPKVNATTYFAHGHLLERQGQFERALVQYRKALALQPEFLSARNRLGITLNKLGRHDEASQQFRLALKEHPELAYLHNNLGFSLFLEGKYAEAEAAFQQALRLKPDFPRAHMNRALALARLQRFDETFAELLAAGDEADANFNMGIILTEAKRYAQAARYLETAIALRPNFDAARQQLHEVARLAADQESCPPPEVAAAEQHAADEPVETAAEPAPQTQDSPAAPVADAAQELEPAPTATAAPAGQTRVSEARSEPTEAVSAAVAVADEDVPAWLDLLFVDGAQEPASAEPRSAEPTDISAEAGTWQPSEPPAEDVAPPEPIVALLEPLLPGAEDTPQTLALPEATTPADEPNDALLRLGPEGATPSEAGRQPECLAYALASGPDLDILIEKTLAGMLAPSRPVADQPQAAPATAADLDLEVVFALINDALTALREQHAEAFEAIWSELGDYLFPATASLPGAAPEASAEEGESFPTVRQTVTGK